MRQIKFRGKTTTGTWIYGLYVRLDGAHFIFPEDGKTFEEMWATYLVDPHTIGQYTGLKDKNGTEIYEGDIVSSGATTGIVVYDCEQAGFLVQKEKSIELRFYSLVGIEAIGNIHDNPEQLKQK